MGNTIPRRVRLDLNTPAELSITKAIDEVEKVGAAPKLTMAIIKLLEAKDLLSDYVDENLDDFNLEVQSKQSLIHDVTNIPLYTKGKWYFQTEADAYTNIIRCDAGKGKETLYIGSCAQTSNIESQANAQLMASAPDLLEALQELHNLLCKYEPNWYYKYHYNIAKKAIEKGVIIKEKGFF